MSQHITIRYTLVVVISLTPYSYATANNNKIYFSGGDLSSTVTCLDCSGTVYWKLEDNYSLIYAHGITVDWNSNIFVAGCESDRVILISPDGKHSRVILSKINSPYAPTLVSCDRTSKGLLVLYSDRALLFDIVI